MTQTNPVKNNSAFVHLPAELEKEVNAYINKLAKKKNIGWESDEGSKISFSITRVLFGYIS